MATQIATSSPVSQLLNMFGMHDRLFKNVTADLSGNVDQRLSADVNHLGWLAGHLVSTRYFLANVLGTEVQEPHPDLFANGKGIDAEASYPSLDSSIAAWDEITATLATAFQNINADFLDAKAPFATPMGDTMADFFGFMAHHEAYHIGQMGILRKYFGHEGMKYN
ncbi:MAG: DinB family protein [Bacteroidota bacterium]